MDSVKINLEIAYLIFFIVTFLFSFIINKLLVKFSANLGTRSNTGNLIRWNTGEKPSFGGISFFIVFLLSLSGLSFFHENSSVFHNISLLGIVLATLLGFLMGLFDDAFNTNVIIKLTSQIACAVILILTGNSIVIFEYEFYNYLFTVLWVVGMMNSINMLDNMDGISTIVSIFIFLFILIKNFLFTGIDDSNNLLLVGIISSLLGFLIFNFPPSKMFMGDTGSQFLGVVLAVFSIKYIWNHTGLYSEVIPIKNFLILLAVFALPLTDTITVSIKRIMKGKSPFVGGRDHTTHHLVYLGLTDKKVSYTFISAGLLSSGIGLVGVSLSDWGMLCNILFSLYFLIIFGTLFYIANLNKHKN